MVENPVLLLGAVVIQLRKTPLSDKEIDMLTNDSSKTKLAIALLMHDNVDPFGPMHIVVADGNMDDGNLDFCEAEMRKCGASIEEWELLSVLRGMSVEKRDEAWESV